MILKYLTGKNGRYTWNYIDGYSEATTGLFSITDAVDGYDREVKNKRRDPVVEEYEYVGDMETGEFERGDELPEDVVRANKAFTWVVDRMAGDHELGEHEDINAIDRAQMPHFDGVVAIYLHGRFGESGKIVVTNQTAYLLNDNGKTIEKIW
jgi:hypothetical protein